MVKNHDHDDKDDDTDEDVDDDDKDAMLTIKKTRTSWDVVTLRHIIMFGFVCLLREH